MGPCAGAAELVRRRQRLAASLKSQFECVNFILYIHKAAFGTTREKRGDLAFCAVVHVQAFNTTARPTACCILLVWRFYA